MAKTPPLPLPDDSRDVERTGTPGPPQELPTSLVRPDAELARIRREMGGGGSKRLLLWMVLCVIVVPGVLFGGYAFWHFYLVRLSRKSFMDVYANMDHALLQAYARTEYIKIEELKTGAEGASWLLEAKQVCEQYREAGKVLLEARDLAEEARRRFQVLAERFGELHAEAKENELDKHAEVVWGQIEELSASLGDEGNSDFSPEVAQAKLREAIELLEKSRKSYADIKTYDQARKEYLVLAPSRNSEEWARTIPDAQAALEVITRRGQTAVRASRWLEAAEAYREATAALTDGQAQVKQARDRATQVVSSLKRALEQTDTKKLETNAKAAWRLIQAQRKAVEKAIAEYRYAEAAVAANEASTRLAETVGKVSEAKGKRDEVLAGLEEAFAEASQHRKLMQRNWRAEWPEIEAAYRDVKLLAKGEDYVELLEKASALSQRIVKLSGERESLQSSLTKAKKAYDLLLGKVDPALFAANVPEAWSKVAARQEDAVRAMGRVDYTGAADQYREARELLGSAMKQFVSLRTNTGSLRQACAAAHKQCRRGIEVFEPEKGTALSKLIKDGEAAWARRNFRQAGEAYEEARKLLPATRFVKRPDGTVIDYSAALMWAADGVGAGCNAGTKTDWYSALVWAKRLQFAGFGDWRLPSDEELRILLELDSDALQAAFPNTPKSGYWTRSHIAEDVARAFCVDFSTGKAELRSKKDEYCVRPVRDAE